VPFGDVLLARLPFPDGRGYKARPVLVIYEHVDADLLVAPITSHQVRGESDSALHDWRMAGLRLPSTVRMDKLGTVSRAIIVKEMGRLTPGDRDSALQILRRFLAKVLDV
jgi:mRNA interferase MazF